MPVAGRIVRENFEANWQESKSLNVDSVGDADRFGFYSRVAALYRYAY